ncbi:hypothetical protein SAMN05444374_11634 [Rhodococcoides kroppenstedtii]|uniref:Uncharacterized protein n=1 Tax=Rhodococcoides kroppenstedtii TaxID=293050 RepID=A0A1I0UA90_9NOCA|nr:hypothetical protein [Rhodococcus kroppenstedtii]SFA60830.1 hypothetical protein SAMN05444374_11634 [Rhodococcus kroppenstedtii]
MTDPNTVTAGDYELVAALWDQQVSKPGEPFDFRRYRAGDIVTLDVEEARRLVAAGAVVPPGSRQKAAAEAARAAYELALAQLPDSIRREVLETQTGASVDGVSAPGATSDRAEAVQPPKAASKDDWVAYAVASGWSEADAEKLTKKDLIARLTESDEAPDSAADPGDGDDAATPPADGADQGGDDVPERPANVADEETWLAYAIKRGVPEHEAEQLSKQELINLLT